MIRGIGIDRHAVEPALATSGHWSGKVAAARRPFDRSVTGFASLIQVRLISITPNTRAIDKYFLAQRLVRSGHSAPVVRGIDFNARAHELNSGSIVSRRRNVSAVLSVANSYVPSGKACRKASKNPTPWRP
jgi:hypothetical protein